MPPITHVTRVFPILLARDLDEAIDYYCDRLGFEVAWTWGDPISRAGVALDEVEIQLVGPGPNHPSGPAVVYCHMNGVDEYYESFRDRGADICMELGDRPWGMRDFRVSDPSGNQIGFASALWLLRPEEGERRQSTDIGPGKG